MVYWLLSSFVTATLQILLEKLADFGIKAYDSISNVDDKLETLTRTLRNVQSLIQYAEDKQITDMAWQDLLRDLEKVAYDADDLIDGVAIEVAKRASDKAQVNKLLLSLFKHTSGPSMNDVQVKLDGMLKEIDSLCLRELVQGRRLDMTVSKLQTSSLTDDEARIFGREVDKRNVIDMLVSSQESSRGNNVSVIPIVGMIGVGKTTLAQLVCKETEVCTFDLKMWVSVSKDFDVIRLTRSIIEAANRECTTHLLNLDSLQIRLIEILQEKKFLLVLDDLWNEKRNDWNILLKPLKHGLKGSKIIVTTGSHVVSSLVGTVGPYHLKCLSDEDCWSLLKEEANLGTIPELEAIGMKIARKCKGLPWAARIIGSQLHSKVDENEWNKILESRIWDVSVIENEMAPALRRGCHRLPSHLRQCFLYCSMFPQSYDFEKDKLVKMWMGEGFVIPDRKRNLIEDTGRDYFDQLFGKSFFQMEEGKYKMHDAVHCLAQSVSNEKFFRMEETNDSQINRNTRHLSLVCEQNQKMTFEASYGCKGLRTFLLREHGTPVEQVPIELFMELGRLRVLDLSSTHIEELTGSIGNLKHLRFLDLSNTLLKWLPETTHKLCVLQTLRLLNCSKLLRLPKSICKLKSLRHLELGGDSQLTSMPSGIGKLTCLQTVSEFIVGPMSGQMNEFKNMNNIRGSLCIKQLEKVSKPQEALEANLGNKKYLDRLELQWTSVQDARNNEHVLDKLIACPHESLKELIFRRYGGRMFPTWMSNPLFSELTSICFYECDNCALLPPLGQLPKLKSIKIDGMHELTMVDELFRGDPAGFQSLETLEFCDMPKLERWVGIRDNDMTCLCKLTIVRCPRMVILPSLHYLRSLERLEFETCPKLPSLPDNGLPSSTKSLVITECPMLKERCNEDRGEDWMKIEHIPYIEIDGQIIREPRAVI